jgi:small subunit ribosomal protein S9
MSDDRTPPLDPAAAPVDEAPVRVAPRLRGKKLNGYCWGTGRRKTAVARVRVREGSGTFLVNELEAKKYFKSGRRAHGRSRPARGDLGREEGRLRTVRGGGRVGASGAVRMGLARALCNADEMLEPALREAGFLTRDSRMKERKKYGQRGARRRFQFSKR